MSDLAGLLQRIEAAEGPDREIDAELAIELAGFRDTCFSSETGYPILLDETEKVGRAPLYTSSLDAAVALCERVLPGWAWLVRCGPRWACVWEPEEIGNAYYNTDGFVPATPALALCAAVVKAKMAEPAQNTAQKEQT